MDIVSLLISKKYVDDTLKGEGAIKGKSAYEIACDNGFIGTVKDWLISLQGETPQISSEGTWIIGGVDTGVIASPDLAGYITQEELDKVISKIIIPDVSEFVTKKELLESIEKIEIPSIEGLATESFVELKCNEILNSIPTPPSYDEIIFDGGEI